MLAGKTPLMAPDHRRGGRRSQQHRPEAAGPGRGVPGGLQLRTGVRRGPGPGPGDRAQPPPGRRGLGRVPAIPHGSSSTPTWPSPRPATPPRRRSWRTSAWTARSSPTRRASSARSACWWTISGPWFGGLQWRDLGPYPISDGDQFPQDKGYSEVNVDVGYKVSPRLQARAQHLQPVQHQGRTPRRSSTPRACPASRPPASPTSRSTRWSRSPPASP